MNEEIMTNENEVAAEVNENPVVETQSTEVATDEVKSLGKDLAEMAVVGVIIYGFCKLMDFVIDKIKAGIKSLKEKRAAKKAAKAAQAQPTQAPVANVAAPQTPAEGTTETAQQ